MQKQGRIKIWNDSKGFGFIAGPSGGADVFIHISEFDHLNTRPRVDQTILYTLTKDKRGRPRAVKATIKGAKRFSVTNASANNFRISLKAKLLIAFSMLFMSSVFSLVFLKQLPWFVLYLYAVLSIVSIAFYKTDKFAAQQGHWRTTESLLQSLSLLGGWPGALLVQQLIRHKSHKLSFRVKHWLAIGINLIGFGWMLSEQGQSIIWFIDNTIQNGYAEIVNLAGIGS